MHGWIAGIPCSDKSFTGTLLGCDGKLYVFRESANFLVPTLPVCFTPGEAHSMFPLAVNVCPREETVCPTLVALRKKARSKLSENRYLHCFRVSKIARVFAEMACCPADKAEITGLLHDIAKEQSNEENARIILENRLPIASFELGYHHILHAMAGTIIVKHEFGITDSEILDGIRYHNGRPAMGKMEKIVFMADHIDKILKDGVNVNPITDMPTLDEAIFRMILYVNQYYAERRQTPDVITECTMNYMLQSVYRASAQPVASDTRSGLNDTLFDAALALSVHQSIHLHSVSNARHLGGYLTASGRRVRNNCLVRSARLHDMTNEDAERLLALGIDTVIDLRSPDELEAHPDQNIESFRYIPCPLPVIELNEYQKNVGEKYVQATMPEEKAFYLSEYLSCLSMEDMYLAVLTDTAAVENLRKIFSILLDSRIHGVLFHCTSGKDRTGIVAALILLCLGADLADIRMDYYASAVATFAATEAMAQSLRKEKYDTAIDEIRYYNGIGKNIAEHVFRLITETYGSSEAYLSKVLQLTDEQRTLLCDKFLEPYETK